MAGPNITGPRFDVVGSNHHKITVCVDPLSSPGSYSFASAFNAGQSGFNDLEDSSVDPDLSGFGITQNQVGPYGPPGDVITTPVVLTPGNCADVFVRMTTVNDAGNRLWSGVFGTNVNPHASLDITATIPVGYTYVVNCTNDANILPQTAGCSAGPIVQNPILTSANIYHGSSVTFTFTAPAQVEGCTLTVGWWKNQGAASAAQFDFDGGTNNGLAVLNTKPKGNPYYILAHQYIAAALNVANGATLSGAALTAFNDATAYFAVASPGTPLPAPYTHSGVTGLADILEDFNSGDIGPGHCDDD